MSEPMEVRKASEVASLIQTQHLENPQEPATIKERVEPHRLMDLPDELKLDILRYACASQEPIQPRQVAPHSPKFFADLENWEEVDNQTFERRRPIPFTARNSYPKALAAVALSATHKKLRSLIDEEMMFYSLNEFEFHHDRDMLAYLTAIGQRKRNAILKVKFWYDRMAYPVAAFVVLESCMNLQHLTLDISTWEFFFPEEEGPQCFLAGAWNVMKRLRGLKSVKLDYNDCGGYGLPYNILTKCRLISTEIRSSDITMVEEELRGVETHLNEIMCQPREPHPTYSTEVVQRAMIRAGVRFSPPEKKPRSKQQPARKQCNARPVEFLRFDKPVLTDVERWRITDVCKANWELESGW